MLERIQKHIEEMRRKKPLIPISDDYQNGYNSGWNEFGSELAKRLEITLSAEDQNAITPETLTLFLKLDEQIKNRVHEVLKIKEVIETGITYKGSIVEIDFKNTKVGIQTRIVFNHSGCEDEYKYYSFPQSYLFDDNWVEPLKEQIERQNEQAEKKRLEDEEKKKTQFEERERAEFERLKQKYGETIIQTIRT